MLMIRPEETTFLLGAGVSASAGLPTAYALIDELSDNLIKHEWACKEIKRLAKNDRVDLRYKYDFLRFETLLSRIKLIYRDISFFDFFERYTAPTVLQNMIVDFAAGGAVVLTPNFDDLLERAYMNYGYVPLTLIAQTLTDPSTIYSAGSVVKLHGSWYYHSSGMISRSIDPLYAVIEVISKNSPGNMLNPTASAVVKQSIDNRTLIVVGYSASDVMDIVPVLFQCKPKVVFWVNYNNSPLLIQSFDEYSVGRNRSVFLSWEELLGKWNDTGSNVTVCTGRAEESLALLGLKELTAPTAIFDDLTWKNVIKKWSIDVRKHDVTGMGFAGLLFTELNYHDLARRALKESTAHRDGKCGWSSARRIYNIAMNEFLSSPTTYNDTIKMAHKSQREARSISDTFTLEASLLLEGRCYFCEQKWSEALAVFKSSEIKRNSPIYKGNCKEWVGRTLLWQGNAKDAVKYLGAACKVYAENGDVNYYLDGDFALNVSRT